MKRSLLITLIILVALPAASSAQSVFALMYIGEHLFDGNARNAALGYSTVAVTDTANAVTMNPASIADINSVTFTAFEKMSLSRVSDGELSSDQNRFMLPSVMIAVPIRRGLVLGTGYRTRFIGKSNFSYAQQVDFEPAPIVEHEVNSSLFTAPFIIAWKPAGWLRISGEIQVDRGSKKDEINVLFEEIGYGAVSSMRTRSYSATSWGASAIVKAHPRIYLGASFDGEVDYSVEERIEYTRSELDSASTWDFTLPSAFSAGVGIGLAERWWLTSSYWIRKSPGASGYEGMEGALSDETLVSVGLERTASPDGGFFSRIPLRLGYYENRWHLEFPAGEQIVSRFFTFGSGFPTPGGPGSLDFVLEFGKTGSVDKNLVDEKVVRFGISLSLSEAWTKRKIERH